MTKSRDPKETSKLERVLDEARRGKATESPPVNAKVYTRIDADAPARDAPDAMDEARKLVAFECDWMHLCGFKVQAHAREAMEKRIAAALEAAFERGRREERESCCALLERRARLLDEHAALAGHASASSGWMYREAADALRARKEKQDG